MNEVPTELIEIGLVVLAILVPVSLTLYAIDRITNPRPVRGRFSDGRMYEISKHSLRIVMEDEETARIVHQKIDDFDRSMRVHQPHMFDSKGMFVGGELRPSRVKQREIHDDSRRTKRDSKGARRNL